MSVAACKLHVWGTCDSTARNQPGFVPDEYVSSLTGEDLDSSGTDPAILAAELCTADMWERVDGGYRVLDWREIQTCVDYVRELQDKDKRAPAGERYDPRKQGIAGTPRQPGRPGAKHRQDPARERIGQAAAASFRCAACGEMAGVVKVARAGTTVDMGPPLGRETYDPTPSSWTTSSARPVSPPMPRPWMRSRKP
jgi:hypothetical protein